MDIISIKSLNKQFSNKTVLNNISINVREGDIFGFIGLNGAGKTTLIRILLNMVKPDDGEVFLFGKKISSDFLLWNEVGYLVETPYSYPNLTVTENLQVYYHLRKLKDPRCISTIINKLKLNSYKDVKAQYLSLGNQQRLGLAKALMHNPKLIILDEPINGLDPEGIVEVRELLKELVSNGSTVFLSSHILEEMSKVANRICIIDQGRLVTELTIEELNKQLVKKILIDTVNNSEAVNYLFNEGYSAILNENNQIEIGDHRAILHPEKLVKFLVEKSMSPKEVYVSVEDLEMFFLRMIKSHKN
jgi:ABC-2 type transport system ATP-binding protein